MGKLALVFGLVLILFGIIFAETEQVSITNNTINTISTSSVSTPSVSTTVASCVFDESLQAEINSLMIKLQEVEKTNDTKLMSEIKQKIQSLGDEISIQKTRCQSNTVQQTVQTVQRATQQISETPVSISTPTKSSGATQSTTITSTCIDESITEQWNEQMIQLEAAVDSNDTTLTAQLGQELESLGQQVLTQIIEKCASSTSGAPSVELFCPVEAVKYASLEKQLNSLKAQEYQARTGGDTELATKLQAQIESLTTESTKYSEQCQAKLLASDTAKYFMTSYSNANVVTTTKQVQQVSGVISPSETTVTAVPVTTTTSTQITVASVCYIPYDLEKKSKDAWNEYYTLVKSEPIDMDRMAQVKTIISSTEAEINKIKQNCQPQVNVTPVATAKICPVVMSPDFEQKCAARNGTITKNFDNNGCLSSYDCVTSTGIISPTPTTIPQSTAPGQVISPGENCTVPVELTQEFEGLWKNYKEALSNNDTQKAEAFKAKISEIEKRISETKGQCMKTIVSERVEAKEVVTYYKEKVTEVMTQEQDIDLQITQLKGLRIEIDNMIAELIKKKDQLNASEVSGVVDEIKVRQNTIQTGSATVTTTTAKVMTQINNKNVEVKPTAIGVEIKDENNTVTSSNLTIKANKVEISDIVIQTTPSAAVKTAKMQNTKTINLTVENGAPIYTMTGDENRKLLWIIPVTMEKQVKIDTSTGAVINEEKPWWSALTSEDTGSQ